MRESNSMKVTQKPQFLYGALCGEIPFYISKPEPEAGVKYILRKILEYIKKHR